MLRKLYDWILHWADTPYGSWAICVLAICESSFFPIPPDPLLIALAMSNSSKAFFYAAICSLGSVLGGVIGYFLGYEFMDIAGKPILEFYGAMSKYEYIQGLYREYDAWAVGIAGFTPIPYKVFTIAAGAFKIDFTIFVVASIISRSARFFILAVLLYKYGEKIKEFIDKYFNILSILFIILLISGFVLIKLIL